MRRAEVRDSPSSVVALAVGPVRYDDGAALSWQ